MPFQGVRAKTVLLSNVVDGRKLGGMFFNSIFEWYSSQ